MRRGSRAVALLLAALAVPHLVSAQPSAPARRIGYLGAGTGRGAADLVFGETLRRLGWIEGGTVAIESRWAGGDLDRLYAEVSELARLRVEVIAIVSTSPGAVAAVTYGSASIPVVVTMHDLRGLAGLGRPGGNITGPTFMFSDLHAKRLQLLKEAVPGARRVATLWRGSPFAGLDPHAAAAGLGLVIRRVEVTGPAEFEAAYATMARERAGALLVGSDDLFLLQRRQIAELSAGHRLPTICDLREYVEAGALMSYGPSLTDMARSAAVYVDKILRGARPGDLPIEQPKKFELVVNLRTAKAIGLTIPQSLLQRADEVIQ